MRDNRIEQHPFEFILKINGHIICQRYFPINNFNPDVTDSLELRELMEEIAGMNNGPWGYMGIIPNYLKMRSIEYLQFFEDNPNTAYKTREGNDIWAKRDDFTFEIKINGITVSSIYFSGNYFPPKIRYKVNLKHETNIWGDKILDSNGVPVSLDILPTITKEIKKTFSRKTYTKEYMGYSLDYLTKLEKELAEKYQTLGS